MNITKKNAYNFKGHIWKIHTDIATEGYWLVELRYPEQFKTTFALLEIWSGRICWEREMPDEAWWAQVAVWHKGVLILQRYPNPEQPAPQGIYAYQLDIEKGFTPICAYPDWHFEQINTKGEIRAWVWDEDGQPQYFAGYLDPEQGWQSVETFVPVSLVAEWLTPDWYTAQNVTFSEIADLIKALTDWQAHTCIAYLEYENLMIMSFFAEKSGENQNILLILNTNAQILLNEILSKDTNPQQKDIFALWRNCLSVIQHTHHLSIYQLNV